MSAKTNKSENNGFLSGLMSIFGLSSPEQKKKQMFKVIARDIMRSRYKFYRPRGNLVLPALAKYLFEIHRVTINTITLLKNAKNSKELKAVCIESFLTEEQSALLKLFDKNTVRESAVKKDTKTYVAELEGNLKQFMNSFKKQTIQQIDALYSQILMFVDLINFDYFFVLKKFDAKFFSASGNQTPRFEAITGEYIKTDLKDFLDVFLTLNLDTDWNKFFDVLLQYKGLEVINRTAWSRVISVSKGVANSGILNMLVQYLDQNPYWKPSLTITRAHITELYLRKLKENAEKIIDEVQSAKFSAETDKLYKAVFDKPPTIRLENYTETMNEAFSSIPEEYSYVMPMNYMQIFFLDYFNKDIQEMVSLILVRGKWVDSEISRQFSTPYYQLQEIAEQLMKFDASLARGAEIGNNLHRALGRIVVKEVATFRVVQALLEDINAQALSVVTEGVRRLVVFGKILKHLIEDYDNKATNEFLINWQEVSMASDPPLKTRMVTEYKRIYHLVQLLKFFLQ